jgi:hypothetical protein
VSLVFYSGSPFAGAPVPSSPDAGIYGLLTVRGASATVPTGLAPGAAAATSGPARAPSLSPGGPGSTDPTGDASLVAPVQKDSFAAASLAARFLDAVFAELRSSHRDSAGDFALDLVAPTGARRAIAP